MAITPFKTLNEALTIPSSQLQAVKFNTVAILLILAKVEKWHEVRTGPQRQRQHYALLRAAGFFLLRPVSPVPVVGTFVLLPEG
jgi:hypothetical protein